MTDQPTPRQEAERIAEDNLYSDRMDAAMSAFVNTRHGIQRNADRASEEIDGEKVMRRALAAAIDTFNTTE